MHVVPTRESSPQHKKQKLTGHQAPNRMGMHGLNNLQLEQHRCHTPIFDLILCIHMPLQRKFWQRV